MFKCISPLLLLLLSLSTSMPASADQGSTAQLPGPRASDSATRYGRGGSGPVTTVLALGDDLQTAVNAAKGGDTIVLPDGYLWYGNLKLPGREPSDTAWITVRSSLGLADGQRVNPGEPAVTLVSPNSDPVISNDQGNPVPQKRLTHHWRFDGLELTASGTLNWNLVACGPGDSPAVGNLPHHLEFTHNYVHGADTGEMVRGFAMDCNTWTVADSYVNNWRSTFKESQAIASQTSQGGAKILNNYLEAAGENVGFSLDVPMIPNLVPAGIEIRHNYFCKPLAWRGSAYQVKNLLEFKAGQDIVIDGNVFENNWAANQNGTAVLFTARGGGVQPGIYIRNVVMTNNIIRHATSAIGGHDYDNYALAAFPLSALTMSGNFLIQNNLFEDLSGLEWGGRAGGIGFSGPPANVTLDHNSIRFAENWKVVYPALGPADQSGLWLEGIAAGTKTDARGMVITNNLFGAQFYGSGRVGAELVLGGAKFANNSILTVEDWRKAAWTAAFPGVKLDVDDGTTGADEKALRANEAAVKAGGR